jgi:hypothetical protein
MNPPSKIIACVHTNTISRCRDKITDPKNQGEELLLFLVRNMMKIDEVAEKSPQQQLKVTRQ